MFQNKKALLLLEKQWLEEEVLLVLNNIRTAETAIYENLKADMQKFLASIWQPDDIEQTSEVIAKFPDSIKATENEKGQTEETTLKTNISSLRTALKLSYKKSRSYQHNDKDTTKFNELIIRHHDLLTFYDNFYQDIAKHPLDDTHDKRLANQPHPVLKYSYLTVEELRNLYVCSKNLLAKLQEELDIHKKEQDSCYDQMQHRKPENM